MMSSLFTGSAPGALARPLTAAPRAPAPVASEVTISNGIVLFIVIALIALIVVIIVGLRMRHSPGLRSAHSERIKEAAAADVAAIEKDDDFFSPDAPGRQEDDL